MMWLPLPMVLLGIQVTTHSNFAHFTAVKTDWHLHANDDGVFLTIPINVWQGGLHPGIITLGTRFGLGTESWARLSPSSYKADFAMRLRV